MGKIAIVPYETNSLTEEWDFKICIRILAYEHLKSYSYAISLKEMDELMYKLGF